MKPLVSEPHEGAETMERIARDHPRGMELAKTIRSRRRIADGHLIVASNDCTKLTPHKLLCEPPSDDVVDCRLPFLLPSSLPLEPEPRTGRTRRRLHTLVVATQRHRAAADIAVIDSLETVTLPTLGADLEPR